MKQPWARGAVLILWLAAAGCELPEVKALKSEAQPGAGDEWLKAVMVLRLQARVSPRDVELQMRLRNSELKAAEHYYGEGLGLETAGDLDGAVKSYQQGMMAYPHYAKLAQAMADVLAKKEAGAQIQEAASLVDQGKVSQARAKLVQAMQVLPTDPKAKQLLARIVQEGGGEAGSSLVLASRKPITMDFNGTDLRTAFQFIDRAFGINSIFDEGVGSQPVTLFAKDVTFDQALHLLLSSSQTFYKQVGPNSILVFPDTKAKRDQYEDLIIRTFPLNTIKPEEMAGILKSMLNLRHITANTQTHSLVIRDTKEVLDLAQELIEANDRKPAEALLEVEVIEISRDKAEKLGLNYGPGGLSTGLTLPQPLVSDLVNGSAADILLPAQLILPGLNFDLFKQDTEAKTLANPRIRLLDGKSAKIHIGDRVPLLSSVITQATGQVSQTYDYRDIGILLDTTADINMDNSVQVHLDLEVSTLGANVGSSSNPAYKVGTRDASTTMVLRDGETAILGGLISDSDRRTRSRIPILGDIPVVGPLFTTGIDDDISRTEILLTLTPRVVRRWDLPAKDVREVYSGSEANLSDKPVFGFLRETAAGGPLPKISMGHNGLGEAGDAATPAPVVNPDAARGPVPAAGAAILAFSEGQYQIPAGQTVQVQVTAQNLGQAADLPLSIAYNADLLSWVDAAASSSRVAKLDSQVDAAKGIARLSISMAPGAAAPASPTEVLATFTLKGLKPGVSYLIFQAPTLHDAGGKEIHAQTRASRVAVQ